MRVGPGIDHAKTERLAAGPRKRAIQFPGQMSGQAVLGQAAAPQQLDLGRLRPVSRLVPIPSPVGIDLGDAQGIMLESLANGLTQGGKICRSRKPIAVRGIVRVQFTPLQHHPLEGVQAAKGTGCSANHGVETPRTIT